MSPAPENTIHLQVLNDKTLCTDQHWPKQREGSDTEVTSLQQKGGGQNIYTQKKGKKKAAYKLL